MITTQILKLQIIVSPFYMHKLCFHTFFTDVLSIEDILAIDNLFHQIMSNKCFKHQYL